MQTQSTIADSSPRPSRVLPESLLDGKNASSSSLSSNNRALPKEKARSPWKVLGCVYHAVENAAERVARRATRSLSGKVREILIDDRMKAIEVGAPSVREGYVILHLHGGGHATGSVWFYVSFLGRLSEATRSNVISIDYRKTPEYGFPAALDDTLAAWRWLLRQGYSPKSVAVLGDSAGGNLAFALSVRLAQLQEPQPAAILGMAPWLLLDPAEVAKRKIDDVPEDRTPQAQSTAARRWRPSLVLPAVRAFQSSSLWDNGAKFLMGQYFQDHDPSDPLVSPLLVSDELLRFFPPVLIHVDKDEPLAVEAQEMSARCGNTGVPMELHIYEGTMHGMQIVNTNGMKLEAQDSLNRIHAFLEDHWEHSPDVVPTSGNSHDKILSGSPRKKTIVACIP